MKQIASANIFITHECNLHCPYCFEQIRKGTISSSVLHDALDFLLKRNQTQDFHLFGGEPFLYPELVFQTLDFCKLVNKNVGIMTNGQLLTNTIIKQLAQYKNILNLIISIDSINHTEKSLSNVRKILEVIKENNINFVTQITISKSNYNTLFETSSSLSSISNRIIFRNLCDCSIWSETEASIIEKEVILSYIFNKKIDNIILLPGKISVNSRPMWCSERLTYINNFVTTDVTGDLYPCESMLEEKINCLGDIYKGFKELSPISNLIPSPTTCAYKNYSGNPFINKITESAKQIISLTNTIHLIRENKSLYDQLFSACFNKQKRICLTSRNNYLREPLLSILSLLRQLNIVLEDIDVR